MYAAVLALSDHLVLHTARCVLLCLRSRAGMQEAINAKHNTELEGRKISVKEAIPQDQIPPEQRGRDRYRASSYRGYECAAGLLRAAVVSCVMFVALALCDPCTGCNECCLCVHARNLTSGSLQCAHLFCLCGLRYCLRSSQSQWRHAEQHWWFRLDLHIQHLCPRC